MIFAVTDDGVSGASEFFLRRSSDRRIERGKNEIAIQCWFETFYDEVASSSGDRSVLMPLHRFRIFFPGRAFGGRDCTQFKPGMARQQLDKPLPDDARCAENAGTELFCKNRR